MTFEKPFDEIENHRLFYAGSYHIVKSLGQVMLGMKVEGTENIPRQGAAIIASKHSHWLDILLLPAAIPDRHVSPLARASLYKNPVVGWLFRRWDAIQLPRENFAGEGKSTWREISRRLDDGRLVPMFPEGTRTPGKMGEFLPGVARFARKAQVSTIPAAVRGANSFPQALLRQTTVAFGEALDPPTDRSEEAETVYLSRLEESIRDLAGL